MLNVVLGGIAFTMLAWVMVNVLDACKDIEKIRKLLEERGERDD